MNDPDRLHASLRSAHEKLCVAQSALDSKLTGARNALGHALTIIERVGVMQCPDWSTHRLPTTELD